MPTAIVLSERNLAHELGYVGDWLNFNNFSVQRIYRDELTDNFEFPAADLFVNMGSLSSVATGYVSPTSQHEIDAVGRWISAGHNYVGLCFGAQVLAIALGGEVQRQPFVHRAIESVDCADLGSQGPWVRWQEDFITRAPGAVVDSRVDEALMIFHWGNAWGIQPHVELTPETLERMAAAIGVTESEYTPLITAFSASSAPAQLSTKTLLDHIWSSRT